MPIRCALGKERIAIDLSRPVTDFLPSARGGKRGGFWKSVGLLLLAIATGSAAGTAGYLILREVFPAIPIYSGLLIGLAGLIASLQFIARRFEWIMPWYYLLPSLLFLITFTLFPVVLTIILAFTDYAGIRNGELNVASTTQITSATDNMVTVDDIRGLSCGVLRNGCIDVPAVVYASATQSAEGVSLEGNVLTLTEAPADRRVLTVGLNLVDIGFTAEFPVVSTSGNQLTLERAPPGQVDLENVTLRLDREQIRRTIVSVDGNTLALDSPLPEGNAFEAIARFNDFGWVGFGQFRQIISNASRALIPVFTWNVSFAVLTVLINTICGVFVAVLLNNPQLRFRGLYRTLLIIPWALPSVITVQVWRGYFNTNFGAVNRILAVLDLPALDWLGDPWPARAAILMVNLWLGLPFVMTATLGALSAIPDDLYEAAKIDGASAWQRFQGVTAPLLRTALIPITLTGFAFNFNNFNVIYLLTDGGPASGGTSTARATDILISWAYNEAFRSQGQSNYGLGSAISVLIFIITIAVSLINFRVTGALKEESNA